MLVDNFLRDKVINSNKEQFVKFINTHPELFNNMKEILSIKLVEFAKEWPTIDGRFLYELFYNKNTVSCLEYELLSAYSNEIIKKGNKIWNKGTEKSVCDVICILLLNNESIIKYSDSIAESKYLIFLSKIMDLYIPSYYQNEIVTSFVKHMPLSEIVSVFSLDKFKKDTIYTKAIDDKINLIINDIENDTISKYADVDISEISHDVYMLLNKLFDIYSHHDIKLKVFIDWNALFGGESLRNMTLRDQISERYYKYFGADTQFVISIVIDIFISCDNEREIISEIHEFIANAERTYNIDNFNAVVKCIMQDVLSLVNNRINSYKYTLISGAINNMWNDKYPNMISKPDRQLIESPVKTPSQIPVNKLSREGLDVAIEAYKKDSAVINKTTSKVYSAYKKYKSNEEKIDSQVTKAVNGMKNVLIGDVKTEVVEGKRFSAIGLLKKILGTAAIFSVAPIKAACFLVIKYALKKNTTIAERKKIIMELEAEIEMINEKIEDARMDGDREAKYAMMRTRTELQNALSRIKYGLEADERSMATASRALGVSRK